MDLPTEKSRHGGSNAKSGCCITNANVPLAQDIKSTGVPENPLDILFAVHMRGQSRTSIKTFCGQSTVLGL